MREREKQRDRYRDRERKEMIEGRKEEAGESTETRVYKLTL